MVPSGKLPNVAELMLAGSKNRKPLAKLSGPGETTTAMLFYSSGTTGAFKAVKLSHRNLIANAKQLLRANEVEFTKDSVMLTSLPNYHIYSSCLAIVSLPLAGIRTVNLPKFELPLYLESIQNHKVTHTFIVPPMAVAFAKRASPISSDQVKATDVGIEQTPLSITTTSSHSEFSPSLLHQQVSISSNSSVVAWASKSLKVTEYVSPIPSPISPH